MNISCQNTNIPADKVEAAAQMDAKTLRGISYGAIGVVIIVLLIFAVKEIVSVRQLKIILIFAYPRLNANSLQRLRT